MTTALVKAGRKRPRTIDIDAEMQAPEAKRVNLGVTPIVVDSVPQAANQQDNTKRQSLVKPTDPTDVAVVPISKPVAAPAVSESQRKTYVVENFSSLPEEFRKCVLKAGITSSQADQHLEVVLNILHFKTKSDFYTPEQLANKNKVRPRRYNSGESLLGPGIVSTGTLEDEATELLDICHKRKDYKTLYQAGKGGFGRVFLARSFKDKMQVAVKRVPHITTKQKRKNFQEIRFLKYCEAQQNIIRYHRAFVVKDELWLVTEFVQGGTLTEAVNNHKFTEPEIAYVAFHILHALNYLHDNKLAHRDLKSANIMFDLSGAVKIIDFGLCTDISQGEVVHMVGSPFWMPPEMIKRQPHGLSVDIWSFAICIMEVANGHPPHRRSSIKAMFQAGTSGYPLPLDSRSKWSAEFSDFLSHCLQTDPQHRSNVKELLQHPFLHKVATRDHMKNLFSTVFHKIEKS